MAFVTPHFHCFALAVEANVPLLNSAANPSFGWMFGPAPGHLGFHTRSTESSRRLPWLGVIFDDMDCVADPNVECIICVDRWTRLEFSPSEWNSRNDMYLWEHYCGCRYFINANFSLSQIRVVISDLEHSCDHHIAGPVMCS